ncbi:PKD domain-containing protein [Candidatus Korarchaeum cryptofilum]|uniref:PKD domain containing protein n=1 Tax=Korarchaeum cryptofilum (strain OPF8) TaxID=374847 RepID=B1L4U8_KORCO|nr:PKD domain-containing protein [Candidatus Korarchaeum cryptofilum]ACB07477.1 PKD domain containing protein [Candidatus Korarchaeum cryptofilum OPF8]
MSSRVLIPILLILLPICLPSAQYYLAVEYPISPGFDFAEVNGVKIYDPSQAVYVKPGDIIEGFFDVRVVNVRGGPWITPVIGTASWTRGDFSCITNDAPDGESIQSYHFHLKAPETPGTYYIGIFAGWMYTCEEVASNDHPPQFNDGDDVWDMSQSDWESIISTGKASKYGQPGRAIRIVVSGAPSIQVDVWTDKGGKGVGNLGGGRYRIGESAVFYCSINGDASYLKVWIEKPNGSIVTLFENFNVKAGTYEFKGVMGEPEGERRLKAVACPAGQSCKSEDMLSRDEVRYYVEGGAKLEISHNFPSEVYQGQEFSVSVTVRNSGNIEVRNVASGIWWADDAFKGMGCTGTDKRDSLKPGEYMQYSCKLKAIGSPGTYDVEISAVADGGISASSKFKVRISQVQDKEPPKVRVIFPNGGETLYIGEAYKITWEATDNVKVEKVHIWLFQGDRQVSTIVTDNPNTGYFVWIPNMEGKFRIRVAAIDPSGNSAYDDSDSDFNVVPKGAENKPPTAYIDSISPNPAYEGQAIYFSGHGYDPDGSIAECEWKADERILSSSCSFSTSLPPGKYTIYFRVKDDKGAWSTWTTSTLVVEKVENKPPVASLAIYPSQAGVGQEVKLDASGSYDPDGKIVAYYFDFGDGSTSGWVSSSSITHVYSHEGEYKVRVTVKDDKGATSETASTLKVRRPSPRYMVQLFGWVYDEDPNSIQQYYNNIEKFTWVSPTWYKVGREGNIIKIGGDTEKFLKDSRRSGVKVIPMISVNVDDRDVYRRIFEDSLFRKKFIEDLKNIFSKYDGINIDFEGIDPKYRDKFVQFMRELYNAFHREGKIVSVDVQPKTCCWWCFWCWLDWDNFPYDYRELSKYTDLFIVMAYDQHYEKSDPGPVSDLTWFEDVVNYALSKVPREKLVIGIPFYGYCWPSPKNGFGVGFQDAMNYARECNATVKFDEKVGEATFSCPSTGICWFNTAESTKLRLRKLAEKGLSKVAVWRIGQEDPETWGLISKIYKQ